MFESFAPLVVWLLTIFFFSTDSFSAGETSRFVVPLLVFLFPDWSPHQIEIGHAVIRKLAHVTAYFILAILWYGTLKWHNLYFLNPKISTAALELPTAAPAQAHHTLTSTPG